MGFSLEVLCGCGFVRSAKENFASSHFGKSYDVSADGYGGMMQINFRVCECGCGQSLLQQPRFSKGHNRRGTVHSLSKRMEMSRARSHGKEPVVSPFIEGRLVQFDGERWQALNPRTGSKVPHAKLVWEQTYGAVPDGYHVHHKNGDSIPLENDRLDNLMLLTKEWNCYFMVNLARGFQIPESQVTEAYLRVEHFPYEQRFREVCRILVGQL